MDINMPGILGTDAAEQILSKLPNLRMVIFSANIQEAFQERAKEYGCLFVAKPVTEKSIAEAFTLLYGDRVNHLSELHLDALVEVFNVGAWVALPPASARSSVMK